MLSCKVCATTIRPTIDKHYVARDVDVSGMATAFSKTEAKMYDAFDCPVCGCQVIAQERKRSLLTGFLSKIEEELENESHDD